jgi:ribosomal protein S18 acetylase RimI-like enzyme
MIAAMRSDIVRLDKPVLRAMTAADIEPATAAIAASQWGDRRAWFEVAVASPMIHAFVAEDATGAIAGTGVATLNGPVGWIGTIWVDPAWRGRGLGRRLTEAPIAAAEAAGCRTLVLVATDAGRPLYERLGFAIQTHYRIVEAPGRDPADTRPAPAGRSVRPWQAHDLGAAAALDRAVTGEDRGHLLAAFATPASARVVVDGDERLRGFVVRAPWGGGATIAPDPADARILLDARRATAGPGGRVRAGLLEDNVAGLAGLLADGWTDVWGAPRMVRGEPIDWQPDGIWGQFNHAVG